MKIKLQIRGKLFISHFLAVFLVSGSIGTYFYTSAMDSLIGSLQGRLKSSSALIGQVIDARELEGIRETQDTKNPVYERYLSLLRTFRKTNPDIAFLYIMRLEKEGTVFVVDSDETDAQALPGKVYTLSLPALSEGFLRPTADDKINTDEWGAFMSGYAPIKNGQGRYLVGMDMRADEVKRKLQQLRISGLISLFGSLILAIVFSHFLSGHFVRRIRSLVDNCRALAQGSPFRSITSQAGDELDGLIKDFNSMTLQLEQSRVENKKAKEALEEANEELEERVQERTSEITNVNRKLVDENTERKKAEQEKEALITELKETISQVKTLKGLLPICSACKNIRDDKGYWNQIESYIKDHSEAEFSHGICPDCAKKLYPELSKWKQADDAL
jgi:HAMP domain-containing protein